MAGRHRRLATSVTLDGLVNAGALRQLRGDLLDLEQLVERHHQHPPRAFVLRLRRVTRSSLRLRREAHRLPVAAAGDRVHVLAIVAEEEVALAEGAAGQHLDGIHAAGVVLDDGDQLLVFVAAGSESLQGFVGCSIADDDSRAQVAVELDDLLEVGGEVGVWLHGAHLNWLNAARC